MRASNAIELFMEINFPSFQNDLLQNLKRFLSAAKSCQQHLHPKEPLQQQNASRWTLLPVIKDLALTINHGDLGLEIRIGGGFSQTVDDLNIRREKNPPSGFAAAP